MNLDIYRKRFAEMAADPDPGRTLTPEEIEALATEITPIEEIPVWRCQNRVCYPPCVRGRHGSRR